MEPWQTYVAEYGQETTCGAVVSTYRPCVYFTCEKAQGGATMDTVQTICLGDLLHVASICNQLWKNTLIASFALSSNNTTTMATNIKSKVILKGRQTSVIRNQSTEPAVIRAWILKPRHHVAGLSISDNGVVNIYNWLSLGFANNSLDGGDTTPLTNVTMRDANYSPYNAWNVCRDFKIKQLKPKTLDPGRMGTWNVKLKQFTFRPLDYWDTAGLASTSPWDNPATTRRFQYIKNARIIIFRLDANPAGFGSDQAGYTKNIQMTTPTVVMDTKFVYETKFMYDINKPSGSIEFLGITTNGTVKPAIVVEGGDVVGLETDAV